MTSAEFVYDVFISYNHADEAWVANTLVPTLKSAGLKVCIDFNDLQAGEIASTGIEKAISASRSMILVLTHNWLKGKWTHFEIQIAINLDPSGSERKVIPLICETGVEKEIPESISRYSWINFYNIDQESSSLQQLLTTLGKSNIRTSSINEQQKVFHNLPSRNEFIGRKNEKEEGHQSLLSRSYIISIEGIGGVGKTALALEIAYECLYVSKNNSTQSLTAKFQGFVWVGAKDQGVTLDNILDEIAQTLDSTFIMKQSIDEKQKSIIKLLQNTPSLLIVDGFENITDDSVRIFLRNSIPEPSKVLITTRTQRIESRAIPLKGLPDTDAIELIKSHSHGLKLTAIENADAKILLRLCKATGGLPLAIKWALGQIKQKGQSLDAVLDFLYTAKGDIFDQIFSRSWNLLSIDAQNILCAMTIFVSDTFQESIVAASNITSGFAFDEALGQLVEMSLVDATDSLDLSQKRYSLHPLTRIYAIKRWSLEIEKSREARRNLAVFFEEYTRKHGGLWNLSGSEKLRTDISNIIYLIRWCWQEKDAKLGINIFDNIRYFVVNDGLWNTALELADEAIKLFPLSPNKLPERLETWQIKIIIFKVWPKAWIHRFRGHYDTAKEEISLALKIFESIQDENNIAMCKRHLGLVLQKTDKYKEAENFLQEALVYEQARNDIYRTHLLTADLASLALQKGDLDTAWDLSKIVLEPSHPITDPQCIARFYKVLGSVARQRGKLRDAKFLCERSLEYTKGLKYLDGIADALFELAQIETEMEKTQDAYQKYEQARTLYKALGMEQRANEIDKIFAQLQEKSNDNRAR